MTKDEMVNYFATSWQSEIEKYEFSGPSLAERISADAMVLDVGCGPHYFKGKIKNIIGIDPAFPQADFQCTLEEFHRNANNKYDAILCLGSLNFGDEETVFNQCKLVTDLLAPNGTIYWRCNPGLKDHVYEGQENIDFFRWSFRHHEMWSKQLGCTLVDIKWDVDNRIYAEWKRLNTAQKFLFHLKSYVTSPLKKS